MKMRKVRPTRAVLVAAALLLTAGPAAAQDADAFELRCDVGDMRMCTIVGLMFETAAGTDENMARAVEAYRRACEGGEMSGCTGLGLLYEKGRGVALNPPEAARWYRLACDGGDVFACDLLRELEDESPITAPREFLKTARVGDANTGEMLAGALVQLPRLGLQVITDAEGRVALGRIPEGIHDVVAEAFGYGAVGGIMHVPGYAEVVVLLEPVGWAEQSARGRIEGYVRDEANAGIADVQISVVGQPDAVTSTNQLGAFALDRVEPGLVQVHLSGAGYATRQPMVIVQRGGVARLDVAMAGEDADVPN